MTLILRHVEPLDSDLLDNIDPVVDDFPHDDESAYYHRMNSEFQLVLMVVNSIFGEDQGEYRTLYPYSLSLIPSTKRGEVQQSPYAFVEKFQPGGVFDQDLAYLQLDPFTGEWGAFSELSLIAEMGAAKAYTDELGIVQDYFFLRKGVDLHKVAQPSLGINPEREMRYLRHRARLMYAPFHSPGARQIWGVENGLELFVLHEINRRKLPWPTIQAHIYDDGAIYPTLYHAWSGRETMKDDDFIAEVDFCFVEQKVALFCDGANHRRARIRERDARINSRLEKLGFRVLRIRSDEILADIDKAVGPLAVALESSARP